MPLATRNAKLVLHQEGMSTSSIYYFVETSQVTVCKILRRNQEEGQLKLRASLGHPRLTTRLDDLKLIYLCRKNRKCQKGEEETTESTPFAVLYIRDRSNMVTEQDKLSSVHSKPCNRDLSDVPRLGSAEDFRLDTSDMSS